MIASNTGETPLHVAAKSCNYEAAQMILGHLSKTLSPEQIKEYVNRRTNVNFLGIFGMTELFRKEASLPSITRRRSNRISYISPERMPN